MAAGSYTATTDLTKIYRYIRSITLTETSGSASIRIQVKDTDSGGLVEIALAAVANSTATYQPAKPIRFPGGARLEFVSGTGRVTIDGY